MNDQLKAAFTGATETVKNVLTLASALLTISITFVKDINKTPTNFQVLILEGSWVLLLLSIVFGVATLMAITGTLAADVGVTGRDLYRPNIQRPMKVALLAFLLGVTLTAIYGMKSV